MKTNTNATPVWLTKKELAAVLTASNANLRDRLVLEFTATFALRRSELCAIRLKHLAEGMLRIDRAKGSLPVHEFIPAGLASRLAEYLAAEGIADPEQLVFDVCGVHANRLFKKYAVEANLPLAKHHIHCLRHTGVAMHYRATRDLYATSKFAGHVSIVNTQIYANLSPEEAAEQNKSVLGDMFSVAA